jgi:hypothetical protein
MSNYFKIKGSSDFPDAKVESKFDMGDDPINAAVYSNLAYDLVTVAIAKLGWEYTEWIAGNQEKDAFVKKISEAKDALNIR